MTLRFAYLFLHSTHTPQQKRLLLSKTLYFFINLWHLGLGLAG